MAKTASKSQKSNKPTIPVWAWLAGAALVVVIIVLIITGGNSGSTGLPKEVSVAKTAEMRSAGAFILDVRELSEWQTVHIPGATLIPLGELPNRLTELPKDQEIVVVCRSGNRSAQGRDILLNAGFTNVTSMAGGMNQWSAAGYETTSGD
ncbi:Thiosulfate sulfurtransferase GlpE [bioreactor metagenome]|uniref:Thiosulfate sulfurtransferase GlpE n=1 Tax=bioreactor metagenome TaxID=1076179 RepID=A0A645ANN9_9ZZZZ